MLKNLNKLLSLSASIAALLCLALSAQELDFIIEDPLEEVEKAVEAATYESPIDTIEEEAEVYKELADKQVDQRNAISSLMTEQKPTEWIEISKKTWPELEKTELQSQMKVICEATTDYLLPNVLRSNLNFYKVLGFTHVLVTFDGDESPEDLAMLCEEIQMSGFGVVFAYSGPENLKQTVFKDPSTIERLTMVLAERADAMLLGWRRTSVHLFIQDPWFKDFIANAARAANPSIPIIGEIYFGETSFGRRRMTVNCPDYCSTVVMNGNGFLRTNFEVAAKTFGRMFKDMHKTILLVGESGYYRTRHDQKKGWREYLDGKLQTVKKAEDAGFENIFLFHQDASNGLYDKDVTDDISKTLYKF